MADARDAVARSPDAQTGAESGWCAGGLEQHELLQEVLIATHWLEATERGKPYSASIRFSGRRTGVSGKLTPRDRFERVETVQGIVPGSGLVAITTRVSGINPGEWITTAEPVIRKGQGRLLRPRSAAQHGGARAPRRLLWFWGKPALTPGVATHAKTRLISFLSPPGIIPGVWPALVLFGVMVGVTLQAVLVARAHLQVPTALSVALLASVVGLVGAKAWFLAQRRRTPPVIFSQGLCIQGFLAGVAIVWTAAFALFRLPVGAYLDAAAPGVLLGMAIGRSGCFFGGCCVGRPTASRWGVWASDGRVAARRVPTQLLEALSSLVLGVATLALILLHRPAVPGVAFVAALAAFTLCRQFLLPFRAEPRQSRIGRPLTMAVAAIALIGAVTLSYIG